MQKKGAGISLSSYDDIFETDSSRAENQQEKIQDIPISKLIPFKNHPFKVVDDEAMAHTMESIVQFGVLTPLIARPMEDGNYEIVSGHRRAHAAELAGLTEVPVIVRQMDDDEATVLMVYSNLQREEILPSERAFAYKMKMEAIGHQGERRDLTCGQLGHKLTNNKTREILAYQTGDSARNVQRYNKLTSLNVSKNKKLCGFGCHHNNISKLDVSKILSQHILCDASVEVIPADKYEWFDGLEGRVYTLKEEYDNW